MNTPADKNSTRRFSDRVENYIRWRPGYPDELFRILAEDAGVTQPSTVADIGSGTGISAELFLRRGHTVYAVEPNREMRQAAETLLAKYPQFRSIDGTAEHSTLPDASVDLIVAAQAFHWFDAEKTRAEFSRILRSGGWCALMWNSRRIDSTPFLRAYEALLNEYGTDYREIQHTNIDRAKIAAFYAPETYKYRSLYNEQRFNWEGLRGRVLSSSYVPAEGQPQHAPLMQKLKEIFEANQSDGQVCFEYDTEIHLGQMPAVG
ncbi:MAG: Methyltransferase [Planctomycetaceae bacterium]|nr:Methyltransferase [Planctomycetaceae bacterium]